MKMNKMIIAAALVISAASYAQKDELKTLKKIYSKDVPTPSDIAEFKTNLTKLEPLATEEGDKIYYNYYKAILPQMEIAAMGSNPSPVAMQKLFSPKAISDLIAAYNTTLDYEKKTGKKVFTDDIKTDIESVKPILVNVAVQYGDAKKYNEASGVLYSIYQLDKKDQEKLYYAANYSVNGKDYDKALEYYKELKTLNYSGEGKSYYATNKQTKVEDYFGNTPVQRDLFVKSGQYEKPREETTPSKRGEIYKNIALILVEKGKNEEAKEAFADAIRTNPNDVSLLIYQTDLYLKLKDYDAYTRLVNEVLAKEPNNADLNFNLGVISANGGRLEEAEKHYKRSIEIDPNYFNSYLNLAELKMRSDEKFVTEINKLGTSDKELKKYEVLKAERNKNFQSILPLLEKAVELKPEDVDAKKALISVYNALEMTDKAKALKAKL